VHIAAARPAHVLSALAGWALSHGDDLSDLTVGRPTLEDIYLKLTEPDEHSSQETLS